MNIFESCTPSLLLLEAQQPIAAVALWCSDVRRDVVSVNAALPYANLLEYYSCSIIVSFS